MLYIMKISLLALEELSCLRPIILLRKIVTEKRMRRHTLFGLIQLFQVPLSATGIRGWYGIFGWHFDEVFQLARKKLNVITVGG